MATYSKTAAIVWTYKPDWEEVYDNIKTRAQVYWNSLRNIETRRFVPRHNGFHWTPEEHCGCLVDFLSTTPSTIFKITPGKYACFKNELLNL